MRKQAVRVPPAALSREGSGALRCEKHPCDFTTSCAGLFGEEAVRVQASKHAMPRPSCRRSPGVRDAGAAWVHAARRPDGSVSVIGACAVWPCAVCRARDGRAGPGRAVRAADSARRRRRRPVVSPSPATAPVPRRLGGGGGGSVQRCPCETSRAAAARGPGGLRSALVPAPRFAASAPGPPPTLAASRSRPAQAQPQRVALASIRTQHRDGFRRTAHALQESCSLQPGTACSWAACSKK